MAGISSATTTEWTKSTAAVLDQNYHDRLVVLLTDNKVFTGFQFTSGPESRKRRQCMIIATTSRPLSTAGHDTSEALSLFFATLSATRFGPPCLRPHFRNYSKSFTTAEGTLAIKPLPLFRRSRHSSLSYPRCTTS